MIRLRENIGLNVLFQLQLSDNHEKANYWLFLPTTKCDAPLILLIHPMGENAKENLGTSEKIVI